MTDETPEPNTSNTFCTYPFYQLALKKFIGKEFKNAAPCCNSIRPGNEDPLGLDDKIGALTLSEIFHSAPMKKLREDLLTGVKNSACQVCWEAEEKGIPSYRHASLPPPVAELEISAQNPSLLAVDISFGEECNLRCRMCTPGQSNKLRIDDKFFRENKTPGRPFYLPGWNDKVNSDPFAVYYFSEESLHFKDLLNSQDKIRFLRATGGETVRTRGFQIFIDTAIANNKAKDITLAYHTNAAKFTDAVVDKLKQFKANIPSFSIDSVGSSYEYIRHPMPWPMLEKSVDNYLSKVPTEYIALNSAVSMMNLHYVTDLVNWAREKMRPYLGHKNEFALNMNFDPVWPIGRPIDISWLPPEMVERELKKVEHLNNTFSQDPWVYVTLEPLIGRLQFSLRQHEKENPALILQKQKDMFLEITAFDQSRNQSYRDFLHPEIVSFLDRIGELVAGDQPLAVP